MTVQPAHLTQSRSAMRRAWDWVVKHEAAQPPYELDKSDRISLALTLLIALAYAIILSAYMLGRQATFATHAEDLGIMDQVLWNTIHGHFMMQTICNSVTDVNCFGATSPIAVSRFAIHFEPILIPLSLLYLIWPSVNAILILQSVVVASGALPIWLLAARRLRNSWWGPAFAALLLIYPPLIAAGTDDFHPETLAATILLWAFYFLSARRYRALLICLGLALLCKETMTLDVMAIGVFVTLIHRRRRLGLSIVAAGALTLALALLLMRLTSPLGSSPVASRITYLLPALAHDPAATVLALWSDAARRVYVLKLLAPYGFLPLLAPWMAALALPSIALNILSGNALMYSAQYQYNTDIAAIFIVASIDALVWIAPQTSRLFRLLRARLMRLGAPRKLVTVARPWVALAVILAPALVVGLGPQAARVSQQLTVRHNWPAPTAHDLLGEAIAQQIPPGASVCAQSALAPHVSQRAQVYQFPSGASSADYLFLDVTRGDYYPFTSPAAYVKAATSAVRSGGYDIVAARDGYLLLRRDPAATPASLPPSFYTFAYASSLAGAHSVDVRFAGGLELVGYAVNPPQVSAAQPELTVMTYWRVSAPLPTPQTVVVTLTPPDGGARLVYDESPTQEWLPPSSWQPGQLIVTQTWPIYLNPDVVGDYIVGVEVRDGSPGSHPPVTHNVPAQTLTPANPSGLPATASGSLSALLARISLR